MPGLLPLKLGISASVLYYWSPKIKGLNVATSLFSLRYTRHRINKMHMNGKYMYHLFEHLNSQHLDNTVCLLVSYEFHIQYWSPKIKGLNVATSLFSLRYTRHRINKMHVNGKYMYHLF